MNDVLWALVGRLCVWMAVGYLLSRAMAMLVRRRPPRRVYRLLFMRLLDATRARWIVVLSDQCGNQRRFVGGGRSWTEHLPSGHYTSLVEPAVVGQLFECWLFELSREGRVVGVTLEQGLRERYIGRDGSPSRTRVQMERVPDSVPMEGEPEPEPGPALRRRVLK